MEPRTKEVRQFIEIYDMIRTDKTGPLSRRELNWDFLVERFDQFFELSGTSEQLNISTTSKKLALGFTPDGSPRLLSEFLPQKLTDEFGALFEEMAGGADRGILATFKTTDVIPPREFEMVLLPTETDGSVTAIGAIGPLTGPTVESTDAEAEQAPIASFRLQEKICFDLRRRLPSRFGGFLIQCIVNMKRMLPGGKQKP